MKSFKRSLRGIVGILVVYVLYAMLQITYLIPKTADVSKLIFEFVPVEIATFFLLIIVWWFYKSQLKDDNPRGLDEKPHFGWKRLLFTLLMALVLYGFQLLFVNSSAKNVGPENQLAVNSLIRVSGIVYQLFVAVIGPIFEEFIFRGLFFNVFFRKSTVLNNVLGVIVGGLVFGLMHEPAINSYLLIYWGMGAILTFTYLMTRDLRYSILVHIINNVISLF